MCLRGQGGKRWQEPTKLNLTTNTPGQNDAEPAGVPVEGLAQVFRSESVCSFVTRA